MVPIQGIPLASPSPQSWGGLDLRVLWSDHFLLTLRADELLAEKDAPGHDPGGRSVVQLTARFMIVLPKAWHRIQFVDVGNDARTRGHGRAWSEFFSQSITKRATAGFA
jgi:hypothetical protein